MNIPKDGPGGSAAGSQTQDNSGPVEGPLGSALSGQGTGKVPHGQVPDLPQTAPSTTSMPPLTAMEYPANLSDLAEEPADPMARLAEIIAQSPTPARETQPPITASSASSPSLSATPSLANTAPLPPPVIVPQPIEFAIEDRLVVPAVKPARKRFSLFGSKSAEKNVPTVAELVEPQRKRGLFRRKTAHPVQGASEQQKRTGRDKRYARRRRRVWFEELLGWIFVPLILVGLYYATLGALALMGTTPDAVIQGLKAIRGHM